MANRVLLGQKGGEYGLWVSKPGSNVLTAGDDDLLFSSSDSENFMIIDSGSVAYPGSPYHATVTIPNMGFEPFVIFSCERYPVTIEYLSNTSIKFRWFTEYDNPTGISRSGRLDYVVTNIPV